MLQIQTIREASRNLGKNGALVPAMQKKQAALFRRESRKTGPPPPEKLNLTQMGIHMADAPTTDAVNITTLS